MTQLAPDARVPAEQAEVIECLMNEPVQRPSCRPSRLRSIFPAMWDSGVAAVERLQPLADGTPVEIESQTSHVAMDVIFRTLFSLPIENEIAAAAFNAFREHQQAQPVANITAVLVRLGEGDVQRCVGATHGAS